MSATYLTSSVGARALFPLLTAVLATVLALAGCERGDDRGGARAAQAAKVGDSESPPSGEGQIRPPDDDRTRLLLERRELEAIGVGRLALELVVYDLAQVANLYSRRTGNVVHPETLARTLDDYFQLTCLDAACDVQPHESQGDTK